MNINEPTLQTLVAALSNCTVVGKLVPLHTFSSLCIREDQGGSPFSPTPPMCISLSFSNTGVTVDCNATSTI